MNRPTEQPSLTDFALDLLSPEERRLLEAMGQSDTPEALATLLLRDALSDSHD